MNLLHKFCQHFKPLIIILLTNFSQILGSWGDWEVDQSKEDDRRSCKAILINLRACLHYDFKIQKVILNLPIFLHLILFIGWSDDTSFISPFIFFTHCSWVMTHIHTFPVFLNFCSCYFPFSSSTFLPILLFSFIPIAEPTWTYSMWLCFVSQ